MVLEFVEQGFGIQDLCAEKGGYLNRPKQKDSDQFTESEVQRNFDIATTRSTFHWSCEKLEDFEKHLAFFYAFVQGR